MAVLCVDFGSTFTKAALIDPADGSLIARGAVPTTIDTDVMDGYHQIVDHLTAQGHPVPDASTPGAVLACSSAGGGLRLAVVGYERSVTAEAGHRVGLSAGAKVVHVFAGSLTTADVRDLRAARPDVVLLVGGTDGGNADVLLHNAARLAKARVGAPVVVAGNVEARDEVAAILEATGRRHRLADNVLPQIGVIAPQSARAAIREVFLAHVIGGKGLSRGPEFAALVRAATPDAMLGGIEVLADAVDGDVLVLDIGGATTDVYSVITPEGEDATLRKEIVAPLWHARTVEGDLGMRWNASGVLEAGRAEHLLTATRSPEPSPRAGGSRALPSGPKALEDWATAVADHPSRIPQNEEETCLDLELARVAAVVAVRRHARPAGPGDSARPLARLARVIGSGGVLRHAGAKGQEHVLGAVTSDHAGGWKVPADALASVDTAYLLFAVGLLADHDGQREAARRLARQVVAAG